MDDGVRIDVESEEIAIETVWLEWKDKERTLSGGEENEVSIYQEDGTAFTGLGFHADARRRTWEFNGSVSGSYYQDDDEPEAAAEQISSDEETADTDDETASSAEPEANIGEPVVTEESADATTGA